MGRDAQRAASSMGAWRNFAPILMGMPCLARPPGSSRTQEALLLQIGRGECRVSGATELARSMVADGAAPPGVARLARVGAGGHRQSNAERDVHRPRLYKACVREILISVGGRSSADAWHGSLRRACVCLGRLSRREMGFDVPLYWVTLRLETGTSTELQDTQVPVILLHELWHQLYQSNPARFAAHMLPCGEDGLREFWRRAQEHTWGRSHPALQGKSEEELGTIIPASLLCGGDQGVHGRAGRGARSKGRRSGGG